MKPTMDDVRGLWSDLKTATSDAMTYLAAKPVDTKRIALFQSVAVIFDVTKGLPQKREVTWVNPAGDAYFTDCGHESSLEVSGAPFPSGVVSLVDTEIGLITSPGSQIGVSRSFPVIFDFEWNFRYGRDNMQYGLESALGGTDGFLSRKDFGNKARAQMLGWGPDDPLVVLAGDSVTWTILPTFLTFLPVGFGTISTVTVNLFFSGFRTGTPAEADYELR